MLGLEVERTAGVYIRGQEGKFLRVLRLVQVQGHSEGHLQFHSGGQDAQRDQLPSQGQTDSVCLGS